MRLTNRESARPNGTGLLTNLFASLLSASPVRWSSLTILSLLLVGASAGWPGSQAHAQNNIERDQFEFTGSLSNGQNKSYAFTVKQDGTHVIRLDWFKSANANLVLSRPNGQVVALFNASKPDETFEERALNLRRGQDLIATVYMGRGQNVRYVLDIDLDSSRNPSDNYIFSGQLSRGQQHWHYFKAKKSTRHDISLVWTKLGHDLDLVLTTTDGSIVASAKTSGTIRRNESLSIDLREGEEYYAKVFGLQGKDSDYTVRVIAGNDPSDPDPNDPDPDDPDPNDPDPNDPDPNDPDPNDPDPNDPVTSAFPGAYGYGAAKRNWKNARVVVVDRLTDSKPTVKGELRYAVNVETGPRIVVFKTGGTITLRNTLMVNDKDKHLYIAGQTAPGGGITLKINSPISDLIRLNYTNDIVLRYLRLRLGRGSRPGSGDNLSIIGSSNVMLDHLSLSWSNDENLGMWTVKTRPLENVTVQNNLLAEPLSPHATNFLINSERDFSGNGPVIPGLKMVRNLSIHRNVFTHASHRAPMLLGVNALISNNLTYDWLWFAFGHMGESQADYVNNFLVEGPKSKDKRFNIFGHQTFLFDTKDQPQDRYDESDPKNYYLPLASVYHSGTHYDHYENAVADGGFDEWSTYVELVGMSDRFYACDGSDWRCLQNNRRNKPLIDKSVLPYKIQPTSNSLRAEILKNAGASRRLDCSGNWVANRDSIDARVITDIGNKRGRETVNHQNDVGGYASVSKGAICRDSDNDGMPDDFERRYSLNTAANDAARDDDSDGFSNLEEYLNGTQP